MSEENVGVIRRGMAVINEGRLKPVLEFIDEFVDPDMELRVGRLPDVDRGGGRERVKAFWAEIMGTFEWRFEADELIDAGDAVILVARLIARGRESGAEVTDPIAMVYGFRDGRVISTDAYKTKREALEAAGLSE
jgi:ketosteroid isomerase-like protein